MSWIDKTDVKDGLIKGYYLSISDQYDQNITKYVIRETISHAHNTYLICYNLEITIDLFDLNIFYYLLKQCDSYFSICAVSCISEYLKKKKEENNQII